MATAAPTSIALPSGTASVQMGRGAPVSGAAPSPLFAITGDSLTEHAFGVAPIYWANGLMGAPLDLIANTALQGQSLLGCYNQLSNSFDAAYPGWVGLPALGWGAVRIGTNHARYGLSVAGFESTIDLLIARMLQSAEHVIIFPVPPSGGVALPSRAAAVASWNAYYQTKAAANPTRVHYVDDCDTVRDASGNVIASCFDADEVHQNATGCYRMGVSGAAKLSALFSTYGYTSPVVTSAADVYPTTPQWNPNPTNVGSGGTFGAGWSGQAPTGWMIDGNGAGLAGTATLVAADVGDANQVPWMRITPTQVQSGSNISLTRSATGRTITSTDPSRLEQILEVRLNALDTSKIGKLRTWMQAGSKITYEGVLQLGNGVVTNRAVLRQRYLRLAPTASGSPQIYIYLAAVASYTGPMGSIDLRCITVRG